MALIYNSYSLILKHCEKHRNFTFFLGVEFSGKAQFPHSFRAIPVSGVVGCGSNPVAIT